MSALRHHVPHICAHKTRPQAVTIPHRRPVCFWAKSTLFKNPVVGAILRSSGSIPVARNPNAAPAPAGDAPTAKGSHTNVHDALFRETFRALERGEVIGVFPEGTSYTEPGIAQVKEGAGRAALEYVRWAREKWGGQRDGKRLKIVPVGIVYTDRSQYQSGVSERITRSCEECERECSCTGVDRCA